MDRSKSLQPEGLEVGEESVEEIVSLVVDPFVVETGEVHYALYQSAGPNVVQNIENALHTSKIDSGQIKICSLKDIVSPSQKDVFSKLTAWLASSKIIISFLGPLFRNT